MQLHAARLNEALIMLRVEQAADGRPNEGGTPRDEDGAAGGA